MKRLKFKKSFDGLGNALNLIPESYKIDGKVFEMFDGNEKYKIRWEGKINKGKAIVLLASDNNIIKEDIDKMKHLMNFKSSDLETSLSGNDRLKENVEFNDVLNKTKNLLS